MREALTHPDPPELPPFEDPFAELEHWTEADWEAFRAEMRERRARWEAEGRCEQCGAELEHGRCYGCDQADGWEAEAEWWQPEWWEPA